MKITIHVGLPKCASTSLQAALYEAENVLFPRSGLHHYEHIVIPLKLKGIDEWTAQWISQDWVDDQYGLLIDEIRRSDRQVVLSSERLADISLSSLNEFVSNFPGAEVDILFLYRPKESYVRSVWRHSVYRHDLSSDFEEFKEEFKGFDPVALGRRFSEKFDTNMVDISRHDWPNALNDVFGFVPELRNENVSAPFAACRFLQQIHKAVGTAKFRAYFTAERKEEFAKLFIDGAEAELAPFNVPVIKTSQP